MNPPQSRFLQFVFFFNRIQPDQLSRCTLWRVPYPSDCSQIIEFKIVRGADWLVSPMQGLIGIGLFVALRVGLRQMCKYRESVA